mgnify:CR=1 FL=1
MNKKVVIGVLSNPAARMFLFTVLWSICFLFACFMLETRLEMGAIFFLLYGFMELPILLVAYPIYELVLRKLSLKTDIKAIFLYLLISILLFYPLLHVTKPLVRLIYT